MNEAGNLEWVLPRIDTTYEVVLVDGGSSDSTVRVAQQLRADIKVVEQRHPGKGAAVVEGMLASSGDIVVMIDADGSMDPHEIPAFVGLIAAGADVVKGSRYLSGAGSEDITRVRSFGNRLLTFAANRLFGEHWSELCYGYAAFRRDCFTALDIAGIAEGIDQGPSAALFEKHLSGRRRIRYGHGFEIETLLFTRASRQGLRVCEVASFERDRIHGESNLSTYRDGARALCCMLWERRPAVWRTRRRYRFPERPNHAEAIR